MQRLEANFTIPLFFWYMQIVSCDGVYLRTKSTIFEKVLIFYVAVTDYHKHCSLKQHPPIMALFQRSEVLQTWTGYIA